MPNQPRTPKPIHKMCKRGNTGNSLNVDPGVRIVAEDGVLAPTKEE